MSYTRVNKDAELIDKIESLKPSSIESCRNYQVANIPQFIDLPYKRVFTYWLDDMEKVFDVSKSIMLQYQTFPFKSLLHRKNKVTFVKNMIDLYKDEEINPFILFVNKRMIKWSNIEFVNNYNRVYMNIKTPMANKPLTSIDILYIPFDIVYSETGVVGVDNLEHMFVFDTDGKLTNQHSVNFTYYSTINSNVYMDEVTSNMGFKLVKSNIDMALRLFKENFIVFKNNEIFRCPVKVDEGNIYTIDDGKFDTYTLTAKLFYDMSGNFNVDNIHDTKNDILIRAEIDKKLKGEVYRPWLDELIKPYAPADSKLPLLDQCKANMNYNDRIFDQVYSSTVSKYSIFLDGKYVNAKKDATNNFTIPRRHENNNDDYIMLFVNGLLYSQHRFIYYMANKVIIPIQNILDTDKIEIVFFKDAQNMVLSGKVDSIEDRTFLDEALFNPRLSIYCNQTHDTTFTHPLNGHQQFEVPFTLEDMGNKEKRVRFANNFYYNKPISFCNRNQFRYQSIVASEETVRVKMSAEFDFCSEPSHYMIFINGKKQPPKDYKMALYGPEFPYEDQFIYTYVPLAKGDVLEIFYVTGNEIVLDATIDATGKIKLVTNTNEYFPLDPKYYDFFINGRKVLASNIDCVTKDDIRIVSTESILNLSIVGYDDILPVEYDTLYSGSNSNMTKAIASMTEEELKTIMGLRTAKVTNTEVDISANILPERSVIYELYRDNYTKLHSVAQVEGFRNAVGIASVIDGTDPTNIDIISVGNATKTDNLNVDRTFVASEPIVPKGPTTPKKAKEEKKVSLI